MTEQERPEPLESPVGKHTLVRDALRSAGSEACVVSLDDDLMAVTESLTSSAGVHTVAVVDKQGRLVGVIPMRLLLDELFLDVAPEEFLVGMRDIEDIEEFGRISRAKVAGELMEEPAQVTLDDTVREAFARMHERRLEGLPIVDAKMKVVGYLDRLQLIRLWVRRYGKGRE